MKNLSETPKPGLDAGAGPHCARRIPTRTAIAGWVLAGSAVCALASAQTPEELFELRSTLHTEPLHELPVPEQPGRFWLEIDGTVHEGEIESGFCGATLSGVTEPTPAAQDRFSAAASWRDDDGAAWRFELRRVISLDANSWRARFHEMDNVALHYRSDGNLNRVGRTDFDLDAGLFWVNAAARRGRPGDQTIGHSRGPDPFPNDQFPIIRVSQDGLHATAEGTLKPPLSEGVEEPRLPFRLAIHCEQ